MGAVESGFRPLVTEIEMSGELADMEDLVSGLKPPCNTPSSPATATPSSSSEPSTPTTWDGPTGLTTSNGPSDSTGREKVLHTGRWVDLPVPMKNAQGVFLQDTLYLAGGFTGNSKTDSLVHAHDFSTGQWHQLPPAPVKWSALSVLGERLVLIGGREVTCDSRHAHRTTNRVVVWDREAWKWDAAALPHLQAPRMSPVVISPPGGSHLIVAGGGRGSLDYHAEVLLGGAKRWACGPALPVLCHAHTSAVLRGEWYLLDKSDGSVQHASISAYLDLTREASGRDGGTTTGDAWPLSNASFDNDGLNHTLRTSSNSCSKLWTKMSSQPLTVAFRLASTDSHLLAFSETSGGSTRAYVYECEVWRGVEGARLPCALGTGLLLAGREGGAGEGEGDELYVVGGQMGLNYSSMSHKLTLMTQRDLWLIKKNRQMQTKFLLPH